MNGVKLCSVHHASKQLFESWNLPGLLKLNATLRLLSVALCVCVKKHRPIHLHFPDILRKEGNHAMLLTHTKTIPVPSRARLPYLPGATPHQKCRKARQPVPHPLTHPLTQLTTSPRPVMPAHQPVPSKTHTTHRSPPIHRYHFSHTRGPAPARPGNSQTWHDPPNKLSYNMAHDIEACCLSNLHSNASHTFSRHPPARFHRG